MSRTAQGSAPIHYTADTLLTKSSVLLGSGLAVLLLNLAACLIRGQVMTGLALVGVALLIGGVLVLEAPADPALLDPSLTDSQED